MTRLITRLLLWLVVAALPLQGVTAATMMVKGLAQAGQVGGHEMSVAEHDVATGNGASDSEEHCFVHEDRTLAKQKNKSGRHAKHACLACAACALWSVAPYSYPLYVYLDLARTGGPRGLTESFVSHIPESLQRPPAVAI
ncbi:hypothetical protein RA280_45980 [Cupriavidus sp. CV2]|uniref:hypothetical protein n=1 Tax=Cupriavidus ulmosensis TaxID=3065913 RepID=UPI00296AFDC3|nr:hypothetical protein [Cupriavidus sp. CV2]MDW3688945.1 hypothetical protein [Cupriavidus sp. CV2]